MDDLRPRYLQVRSRSADGFEHWALVMAPGEERQTEAREWAGAMVTIESGTLEVGCIDGGHRTFIAGDILALGWLPLKWIRNPGPGEAMLRAVRRPERPSAHRFARVRPGSPVRSADD